MPPLGLCELVLLVDDVPRATAFYRDVVGLTLQREPSDDWAWFLMDRPGGVSRLALHKGPLLFEEHSPRPPGERFGPIHFAFELPLAERAAAVARLESAGVEVHGPVEFEWMNATSVYFYDPDGNLAEFWSPNSD